jgi:hypothetical protein
MQVMINRMMPCASVASYCFVPSSLILFTLMTEVILSSETTVLTRATKRHIPEDGIRYSHSREKLQPTKEF